MLVSLASCSVNDVEKPEVITADKTTAYAKVVISMPNVTGTRASFDEGKMSFDGGETEESKIGSINLAFYDENGTYVCQASLDSELDLGSAEPQGEAGNDGNNVSNSYAQVLRVTIPEGVNKPTQVVAFINTDVKTNNLNELYTNTKVTVGAFANDEGFVMTNSGYYNGSDYVIAVPVTLFPTEAEADEVKTEEEGMTVIYVERLAAKITVDIDEKGITQNKEANYVVKSVDGKTVTLNYTPKFWGATGTAQEENMVKTQFNKSAEWMNAAGLHRSYWAESVYYTTTPYTVADSPLTYLKFNEIAGTADGDHASDDMNAIGKSNYVFEHTASVGGIEGMDLISNTYVIVTGNYDVYVNGDLDTDVYFKTDEENEKVVDFYLLSNGVDNESGKSVFTIYNETQLMNYLLGYNGIDAVYADEKGDEIEVDDLANCFELEYKVVDGVGKYYLAILAGETVYVEKEGSYVELTADALVKSTNSRHYYFPEGGAYFNVPIPQNISGNNITYGVVRNHSYVLTIEEIQSLGAPLDENKFTSDEPGSEPGGEPVIPDPNFDNYIKAKINILSWHVMKHGVTL